MNQKETHTDMERTANNTHTERNLSSQSDCPGTVKQRLHNCATLFHLLIYFFCILSQIQKPQECNRFHITAMGMGKKKSFHSNPELYAWEFTYLNFV